MARDAAVALCLLLGVVWPAAALVAVPPITAHVVDQTGSLPAGTVTALDQRLVAFEAAKGSQLAVLIVPTTAPEPIEAYALRVAEQWKLGRKKVDDGAILVLAMNDRTVRIEVGYGLEGALNDATSKRIIDEQIVPRLRAQDVAGAVSAGVEAMVKVVDGEPLPAAPQAAAQRDGGGFDLRESAPVLLVVALAVGSALRAVLGRLVGGVLTGVAVGGVAWFIAGSVAIAVLAGVVGLFVTLLGIGVGSFLPGGVFSGGRGGGGGGGGGFGGGGGTFGGGGASGRW